MKKTSYAGEIIRTGLRVLGYEAAFGFIGFMFAPTLIDASPAIRVPLLGLLIALACMLLFMDGSYRGERDVALNETLAKLSAKGAYTPSKDEEARRYRRMKGVLGALVGALPLVLLAAYVAITTQPYAYSLQDLPQWLSPYMNRPEVAGGADYLVGVTFTTTVTDYVRVAVRFFLFPYIALLGQTTDAASLLFDRLSPLIALIMPLMAAIGYQFGPMRHAKTAKAIADAKAKPRKRLKKEAKKRLENKEKKQLI